MLIKRYIFYDYNEIELDFIFTDLSQHFGIYVVALAQFFYSLPWG